MAIPDYSSQFYNPFVHTKAPLVAKPEDSNDYTTLVEVVQLFQGSDRGHEEEAESKLFRWLAKFGIKRLLANEKGEKVDIDPEPEKFTELRKTEFDRETFNYEAYLKQLEKDE